MLFHTWRVLPISFTCTGRYACTCTDHCIQTFVEKEAGNKVAKCHDNIGGFFLFQGHVKQNAVIKNYSSHVRQRALELQGVQQWLRERDVYRRKKKQHRKQEASICYCSRMRCSRFGMLQTVLASLSQKGHRRTKRNGQVCGAAPP